VELKGEKCIISVVSGCGASAFNHVTSHKLNAKMKTPNVMLYEHKSDFLLDGNNCQCTSKQLGPKQIASINLLRTSTEILDEKSTMADIIAPTKKILAPARIFHARSVVDDDDGRA